MSRFKLLYFVIFIIKLLKVDAQISDKRLCVDEECKVPISLAKTLIRYSSPDSRILSFGPNVDITIYSKSAGSREDLWGGEIKGKRGYVPKHMVRETKVFKKPTLLVDTEFSNNTQQVPLKVEPEKVQEPFEVVDGTTLYLNPQDVINPTSTDSPVQSTALPVTETHQTNEELETKTDPENKEDASSPPKNQEATSEKGVVDSIISTVENLIKPSVSETPAEKQEEPLKNKDLIVHSNTEVKEALQSKDLVGNEDGIVKENEEDDEEEESDDDDDDEDEDETEDTIDSKVNEVETPEIKTIDDKVESAPESSNLEEVNKVSISEETSEETVIKREGEEISQTIELPQNSSFIGTDVHHQEELPKIELVENKEEAANASENQSTEKVENIETTTLIPEIEVEVPQPFDDSLIEVTPNPLEIKEVEEDNKIGDSEILEKNVEVKTSESVETKESKIEISETVEIPVTPEAVEANSSEFGETANIFEVDNSSEVVETQTYETQIPPLSAMDLLSKPHLKDRNRQINVENVEEHRENNDRKEINEEKIAVTTHQHPEELNKEGVNEINDFSFNESSEEAHNETPDAENKNEDGSNSGFLSGLFSILGGSNESAEENIEKSEEVKEKDHTLISEENLVQTCDATSCDQFENEKRKESADMDSFSFNSDILIYLITTAVSVIIFLFGYIALDKSKREGPLIAKINTLEKELLIVIKENQILQEKLTGDSGYDTNDKVSNEIVENLKRDLSEATARNNSLEEQVQLLEKELENSTEVGMELNRMLSEILSAESGSQVLKANVEHLQRQLAEQQATVNSVNETLAVTNTENHELRLELELTNKKVVDLQAELDKLLLNVLKIEEEKETQQSSLENEIINYKRKYEEASIKLRTKEEEFNVEVRQLKNRLDQYERSLELKTKEHDLLTDTLKQLKAMKTNDGGTLRSLLDVTGLKAELQQLKIENQRYLEKLQKEEEAKNSFERRAEIASEEARKFKEKYDEVDKLRVETETKLEVLSNYFKDREAQLQKEISKHESMWEERQGETTTTTERIKFMQEQLQNYKSQTESLKQEIMSQEVELKSQISVLEKKAHENWVSARQAERKLEEARQESAQLRHRLTLRERALQEDKSQHRFQPPIEQNGDAMPLPPTESPPYGARDHVTKSPPMPALPRFLPPPGVPFMPPPFIPPPPAMFPGDHRPPPLGRMSSPPGYSPGSRGYSPYDRDTSSPSDSEYGTSPPPRYGPFSGEERRDYKRGPPGKSNGRSAARGGASSGSGNSNESLDKIGRQQSKV